MKIGLLAAALLVVGCGKHYRVPTTQDASTPSSTGGTAPSIQLLDGDGTADGGSGHAGRHLVRGVIVHGTGLDGAAVTLEQDGEMLPLATSAVQGGIEALLPADVKPGSARLHLKTAYTEMVEDLVLLQGEKGADGADGKNGVDGARGLDGMQGAPGATGPMGPMGPAGPQGFLGLQGAIGPTGERGLSGPPGERGVAGPQGPTGPGGQAGVQGVKGDKGDRGATGDTGADGILGTDIITPSGNLVSPDADYQVIGGEQTVSLADDAYLVVTADVRASGGDHYQPRDVKVGIRIAGVDHTDAADVRPLRVQPAFDKQTYVRGALQNNWIATEGRMTFLFKTSDKVKSGNVKVGLVVRCAESDTSTCDNITFNPTEQHILVTQLR